MPCRPANTHSETELDVRAYPLVGSIPTPDARYKESLRHVQGARITLLPRMTLSALPSVFDGWNFDFALPTL
jgi:hypothetical protein